MKIAILTSSRADYSIYFPLLLKLKDDPYFDLNIVAFGTHLSHKHGYTLNSITQDGFTVPFQLDTIPIDDSPESIVLSMSKTLELFSSFWNNNKFDLVFALGDRYEMFSAVTAGLPFNVKFAHIHGGETTLGSIDNSFRHSISLMSEYHFTTTEIYKQRIIEITGKTDKVYNLGALSIDNLQHIKLYSKEEFETKYSINLNQPSILITFHPETVSFEKNEVYINELISALKEIKGYQLIITMPNADTTGNMIREKLIQFINSSEHAIGIESFGTVGYLSCMKYCSFLLGNTSSGFVEASFFPKYVINLGDRQKGRIITPNIIQCEITKGQILAKINDLQQTNEPPKSNIYGDGNTAGKIIKILKSL